MGNFNKIFTEVEVRTMLPKDLIEAYIALADEYVRLQKTAVDLVQLHNRSFAEIVSRLEKAGHLDDLGDLVQKNVHTNSGEN